VLFIALCATLGGADSFTDIEDWGRAKEVWLRERLALPNGMYLVKRSGRTSSGGRPRGPEVGQPRSRGDQVRQPDLYGPQFTSVGGQRIFYDFEPIAKEGLLIELRARRHGNHGLLLDLVV
jgi:hypothetical protein